MSVQTEPKNEHDPHQCQSPRTLPDTVSQYPNTPPSEPHPHDHQILHVYTWQAIHNGISISLHYDSCGCICSPAYFTPQAAGNTTLRDLTKLCIYTAHHAWHTTKKGRANTEPCLRRGMRRMERDASLFHYLGFAYIWMEN